MSFRVLPVAAAFLTFAALFVCSGYASAAGDDFATRYEQAEQLRRGIGVPRDLNAALALHSLLAEEGHVQSLQRVAAINEQLGRYAEAISAYEAAISTGSGGYAQTRLAAGHAMGTFGDLSRPEWGVEQLRALSGEEGARSELARFYLARSLESTSDGQAEALALYRALSDENYGPAQSRLGHAFLDGDFGQAEPADAVKYFERALANGSAFAQLWLAEALIAVGQGEAAREAVDAAVNADLTLAEARRIQWHLEGAFGEASDPEFARSELKRLAEDGRVDAARQALRLHERRSTRIRDLDLGTVIEQLEARMADGNADATEILARAYIRLSWLITSARERHAQLVTNHGYLLEPGHALQERIQAVYSPVAHRETTAEIIEMLAEADGETYVKGMLRLRSIERTAYVTALQTEMGSLGYSDCPVTGRLTSCTLNDVLQFCANEGFGELCNHGPMLFSASRAITRALAEKRMAEG